MCIKSIPKKMLQIQALCLMVFFVRINVGLNTQSKILPRISLGSLYDKQKEAIKCVEDSEEEDDGQVNVNFQNESIKGDKSTNEPASENKFSFYNFDKKNTSNDEIDESDDGDDESSHELYSKKNGRQTNNKSQMV